MKYENGCKGCGACCKKIGFDISTPETLEEFEDIKWYLFHKGISVYIDRGNEWTVEVQTRCKQLDSKGRCKIYESRPPICYGFDPKMCDIDEDEQNDDSDIGREFLKPEDVEEYIEELREKGELQ